MSGGSQASLCQPPHCVHSEHHPLSSLWSRVADNTEEGLLRADTMLSVWAVCPTRPWARSKDSSMSLFAHPSPKRSPSRKSSLWGCSSGPAGPDQTQTGFSSAADGCLSPSETTHSKHPPSGTDWALGSVLCIREALKQTRF